MKYHIFFNFGNPPKRVMANTMREEASGKGKQKTTYITYQATCTTCSKTWKTDRRTAEGKVSYFLQLWKSLTGDLPDMSGYAHDTKHNEENEHKQCRR